MNAVYPFADVELARRLERAEAVGNASFVEARAHLQPEVGAQWIEVAGAYAMFDGVESPITQTFGLGVFDPVAVKHIEAIESFFSQRNAPTFHEVSPLVDPSLLLLLSQRGYHPIEVSSVMYRPIAGKESILDPVDSGIEVHIAQEKEYQRWARTAALGWSEYIEYAAVIEQMSLISASRSGNVSFFASIDGVPVATGGMSIHEGVALLAGASTIPEARRQGAQRALLASRLRYAADQGCDLAMMCALPGSASQRNAERHGFRIAYTRTKWHLADGGYDRIS